MYITTVDLSVPVYGVETKDLYTSLIPVNIGFSTCVWITAKGELAEIEAIDPVMVAKHPSGFIGPECNDYRWDLIPANCHDKEVLVCNDDISISFFWGGYEQQMESYECNDNATIFVFEGNLTGIKVNKIKG
ncbi:hypothetical protein [Agarivorans sp. JK6]|uniref:hypothetical protein n=1 Tax=Agarivorans sp. JK6 TaxID=2997426 RepID=UPI003872EE4B